MSLSRGFSITVAVIAALVVIELFDQLWQLELFRFGVFPRSVAELPNILVAPLIHGDWHHLVSNSLTLLVLLTTLLVAYPRSSVPTLALIYLGSGIGIWLFARDSFHYGASGITHGLMFYIFVSGILRRDRMSIALSMIVFFLYGSMVWSIFPQAPGISYESHFFGALAGVLAALLFSRRDPMPAAKRYDWEEAGDDEEDDARL